jgi:hypothetical protein
MNQKKKTAVPLFGFLLFGLLLSLACNKDTPVSGSTDLIDRSNLGNVHRRNQTATLDSTSGGKIVNTLASSFLLLGTFKNIESRILLRFDPLPDSGTVLSAKVKLPADSVVGQTGTFEATIHQVISPWKESEITWTGMDFPVQFNNVEMGTTRISAGQKDTVSFDVDPALAASWFASKGDSRDSAGVLIQARNAGFMKKFYPRSNSDKPPYLELTTRMRIGNRDTTITTRRTAVASIFVFQRMAPLPDKRVYVSNGEQRQSVLFFDLRAIIPDTIPLSATVNRASLVLNVDGLNSVFVDANDLLSFSLCYALKKFGVDTLKVLTDSLFILQVTSVSTSKSSVELDLTSLVQSWVRTPPEMRKPPENYGYFYLLPNSPSSSLTRATFYSREDGESLAPKIRIEYTTPPKTK